MNMLEGNTNIMQKNKKGIIILTQFVNKLQLDW